MVRYCTSWAAPPFMQRQFWRPHFRRMCTSVPHTMFQKVASSASRPSFWGLRGEGS